MPLGARGGFLREVLNTGSFCNGVVHAFVIDSGTVSGGFADVEECKGGGVFGAAGWLLLEEDMAEHREREGEREQSGGARGE